MSNTQTSWGSRLGFILASAGSAVGLGAIWKFPYMAGTNGGAVFMLPYIFFTLTVGVALLLAEFSMGRAGRRGPISSLAAVAGKGWGFFGGVGVVTVFIILSFYSVVGGWCLKYLCDAVMGTGITTDAKVLGDNFGGFVSNGTASYTFLLIFLVSTALVVLKGVEEGIERIAKYLMPLLFILMIIFIIRGVTLPGGMDGVSYLFMPKWEDFNSSALFNAMGFCFFSLSLGAGTMITYGSYLKPDANLPNSVGWVAFLGILSSILGGLMVMPAVFAFGLDPTAGPGLTFVTMPAIFAQMPMGQLFAIIFYVCLMCAAITSSVSMMEACCSCMRETFMIKRSTGVVITTIGAAILGLAATLSFGAWSDVQLFGKNIFDLLDYVTSNIGMPLSTFGIAIAAAWVAWKHTAREICAGNPSGEKTLGLWRLLIGVVSPLFVVVVALGSI